MPDLHDCVLCYHPPSAHGTDKCHVTDCDCKGYQSQWAQMSY